jgi:hypothetical protein
MNGYGVMQYVAPNRLCGLGDPKKTMPGDPCRNDENGSTGPSPEARPTSDEHGPRRPV